MSKLQLMSVFALAAAAIAPAFAHSAVDVSAERGVEAVHHWTSQMTRAQVQQEIFKARADGTLYYVGDQPVVKNPAFPAPSTQSMGYGSAAPVPSVTPAVSHDGYRLLGDIYVKVPAH